MNSEMNKNYILLTLLLLVQVLSAQEGKDVVVLKKEYTVLKKNNSYKDACKKAIEIADLFGINYPDSAVLWSSSAYELSVVAKDVLLQKKTLVATSNYEFLNQQYEQSVLTAEKADELLKVYPEPQKHLYLLYRLAEGYEYTARHLRASQIYQQCYKIAEEISDNNMLAQLDIKRGNIKQVNDNPVGAFNLYKKAINRLDPSNDLELKKYYQARLEYFDVTVKNRDLFTDASQDVCTEIEQAILQMKEKTLAPDLIASFFELNTRCVFKEGNPEKIKQLKLPSISELKKSTSNKNRLQLRLDLLTEVALSQNKIAQAQRFNDESFVLANQSKNATLLIQSYKLRQEILEKQGRYKKAFEIAKRLGFYEKEFYGKQRMESLEILEANLTNKEKEMRILLLNEKNESLESRRKYIITSAIGFSILSFLAIWFFYRSRVQNDIISQQNYEIATQNVELEKMNVTKDHLFSILGHDLRKPAIAFRGISKKVNYLLKKEAYDTLSQLGDEIENEAVSLIQLTDNLLNWALTQKNALSYLPSVIGGKDLAEEILDLYKNAATKKKISLIQSVDQNLLLYADPNGLSTILRNLVDNAIKFSSAGDIVKMEIYNYGSESTIIVSDSGTGIKPEKIKTIFELSDNKSEKGTDGEKGTGLGLHLVKELIELNRGTIKVESELGVGTNFTISLPKYELE